MPCAEANRTPGRGGPATGAGLRAQEAGRPWATERRSTRPSRSARAGRSRAGGAPSAAGSASTCRARSGCLVDVEALLVRPGELGQEAHGGAAVHGVEVAAVLGLGGVGEAEAHEVLAHDHLVLAVHDVERVVVDRALAEGPAALVEVALDLQLDDAPVALVGADLELVVLAVLAEVLAAQAVLQEDPGRVDVADEGRRAVRAADRVLARRRRRPCRACGRRRPRPASTPGPTDARTRGASRRSARSRSRRCRVSLRRSAQKPIEPVGTERFRKRACCVPRLPIQPAWRYGKLVSRVLASPVSLP